MLEDIDSKDYAPFTLNELKDLYDNVVRARSHAYAPYSHFRVGAVILTTTGEFITGCNVENASYPAGICAERTALVKAVSEGVDPKTFRAIAVITDENELCSPCGVCRQMIREFGTEISIVMFTSDAKQVKIMTLEQLLPMSFGPANLLK
ncbi:uncharacterized protein SAPINGB_P000828 [Magnusiomyces paraingens]|uniref:Cytidine deaminase n=1 Tax=Magnusiomyces paraingens TaxID=2606893 RepID=A0A5E8B351_9ASCO|nr:uncharacterized protein SAPINGB_P000828 [Saprochaete ingens]VVT45658.1 unnamed protein product [Saprochaete ingens]